MSSRDDRTGTAESRRVLDRIAGESEPSALSRKPSGQRPPAGEDDPLDAWATRIGRTIGLSVTVGLLLWLVLHVTGRV